jgi:hypothetical protein
MAIFRHQFFSEQGSALRAWPLANPSFVHQLFGKGDLFRGALKDDGVTMRDHADASYLYGFVQLVYSAL